MNESNIKLSNNKEVYNYMIIRLKMKKGIF
jgi:hypothetical protein